MPAFNLGTGWRPEKHDPRDPHWYHETLEPFRRRTRIRSPAERLARRKGTQGRLPKSVDLREWCPPVKFQGGFNTCTAHVVTGMLEFYEKKAHGESCEHSRLFLFKVTKNLLREEGNTPLYIRQTIGALKLIGIPEEKYWPYPDPGTLTKPRRSDPMLDEEPPAFCYAVAGNHRTLQEVRLDRDEKGAELEDRELQLHNLKMHLAASMPFSLGFPLFAAALAQAGKSGRIPYPSDPGEAIGAHAVFAVGYDDSLDISGPGGSGTQTAGAFLIQNSWSEDWGEKGFGWLPYAYVLSGAARDFWTILKMEWVDTDRFQLKLQS